MSGLVKTVLKTESSFYFNCLLLLFIYLFIYLFAFVTTAACNSYLA